LEGVVLVESGGTFFRAHEKLEANFFLVTDGQHHNGVTINAVSCDIAAITKVYQRIPSVPKYLRTIRSIILSSGRPQRGHAC
jgi:hypothetical protein